MPPPAGVAGVLCLPPVSPSFLRCARGTIPVETVLPGDFQDFCWVVSAPGELGQASGKASSLPLPPPSCLGDGLRWAAETRALSSGPEVRRGQELAQPPVLGVLPKGCFLAISNQSRSNLSKVRHWKDMGSPLHQQEGRGRAKVKGRKCGSDSSRSSLASASCSDRRRGALVHLELCAPKGREWIRGYQCSHS